MGSEILPSPFHSHSLSNTVITLCFSFPLQVLSISLPLFLVSSLQTLSRSLFRFFFVFTLPSLDAPSSLGSFTPLYFLVLFTSSPSATSVGGRRNLITGKRSPCSRICTLSSPYRCCWLQCLCSHLKTTWYSAGMQYFIPGCIECGGNNSQTACFKGRGEVFSLLTSNQCGSHVGKGMYTIPPWPSLFICPF